MSILDNIISKQWDKIEQAIISKNVEYNQLLNESYSLIHFLVLYQQLDLIKLIPTSQLKKAIFLVDSQGNTPIMLAANSLFLDMVTFFLDTDRKCIYIANNEDLTPIYALLSQVEFIKSCIKKYQITDHKIAPWSGILQYFVHSLNTDMITFLLDMKISPAYSLSYPANAPSIIELSVGKDEPNKRFEVLELILPFVDDVNVLDEYREDAFGHAVQRQSLQFIQALLNAGADYNYAGWEGNRHPMTLALTRANSKIVKLLFQYNINLDVPNRYGSTPAHYQFGTPRVSLKIPLDIKREVLSRTKSVNSPDIVGNTALLLLMKNDSWKDYVDILSEKKLKIYFANSENVKPITLVKPEDLDDFYSMVYDSYIAQLSVGSRRKFRDEFDRNAVDRLKSQDATLRAAIIERIKSGTSHPLNEMNYRIKLINPPKVNFTHYSARTADSIFYLLYLLRQYPLLKIPIVPDEYQQSNDYKKMDSISDYNTSYKYMESHMRDFWKFSSIKDKRIRDIVKWDIYKICYMSPQLMASSIYWHDADNYYVSPMLIESIKNTLVKFPQTKIITIWLTIVGNTFDHANVLQYDVSRKLVEAFDPHQDGRPTAPGMDVYLNKLFSDNFKIRYYPAGKITPRNSFQVYDEVTRTFKISVLNDPIGFCLAWCTWYTQMRIINYDINPKILSQIALHKISSIPDQSFTDYIRNYSEMITVGKTNILRELKFPEKYWYYDDFLAVKSSVTEPMIVGLKKMYDDVCK
jgi:ankyrin repeat protein